MVETPNRKREPLRITNQQGEDNVYQDARKQRFYTGGIDDRRCDHWNPGCGRGPVLSKIHSESASDQQGFPGNARDRNEPGGLLQLPADLSDGNDNVSPSFP